MRTLRCLFACLSLAATGCGPIANTPDPADDRDAETPDASPDAEPCWRDAAHEHLRLRLDVAPEASSDAAPSPDRTGASAAHGDPTPLASRGGPVLAHPQIVTVTYANEPNRDAIERFSTAMTTDPWWTPAVSEYGVGPVTLLGKVRLADSAPTFATQAEISTYLADRVMDGTLPRNPDGSSDGIVYMLYFPHGSRVVLDDGMVSCGSWHGVHDEVTIGATKLVYALSVDCGPGRGFDELGYLEVAASHELLEAVTDPYPKSAPAYETAPDSHDPWSMFGELTDRCVGQYLRRGEYALARNWSNAAATRGEDPCAPAPDGSVYYNVTTSTPKLHGAAGTTLDVPITGWSAAPVADFQVVPYEVQGFDTMARLGATSLNNGVTTTLRLTIPAGLASGTRSWLELLIGPNSGDLRTFPMTVTVD